MAKQTHAWILSISFFLVNGTLAGHISRNVALKSPACQSSETDADSMQTVETISVPPGDFPAARAVDGNRDSAQTSTCTVTKPESGPWWMVDLQREYKVDAVAITSSTQATLDGVEVWLGTSGRLNDTKIRCALISVFPKKHTLYIPCGGLGGRHVTVLLPGDGRALSLCEVEVYPVDVEYPLPNVALKGVAAQSSACCFPDASKAIDGRRDSFYDNGQCSHNAWETTDPWWQVDLRRTYIVTSVKVTNRGDCCAERLDGAEIRIGNALENGGTNNPRCAFITHIKAGKTSTFHCEGGSMAGRFVNIIIPGTNKTLTLCEVEVYGVPEETPLQNVALNKMARWSYQRQYSLFMPCTVEVAASLWTLLGTGSSKLWWKIDLSAVYKVRAISITPRKNLKEIEIFVKNLDTDLYNDMCIKASPLQETQTHTFHCGDMLGRYLQFVFPSPFLTVCEVEVYASPAESAEKAGPAAPTAAPPSESTRLNGRTVTVVGERLCWSDALLYCRRNSLELLSLHSEEEQKQAAQLLSRAPFAITDGVWLGLRRYIMGEIWFWMSGNSMNFSHWSHNSTPHQYSSPCGRMDVGEPHWWAARSCDEHLNFICQSGGVGGLVGVPFHSYTTAGTG